jgi:hypothetical protein
VHRAHEEVTGAVAGEHAACAVGAVRRGCEAEHEDARLRITEAWNGTSPVDTVAMRRFLRPRDPGAISAKAPTFRARDDRFADFGERCHGAAANCFGLTGTRLSARVQPNRL